MCFRLIIYIQNVLIFYIVNEDHLQKINSRMLKMMNDVSSEKARNKITLKHNPEMNKRLESNEIKQIETKTEELSFSNSKEAFLQIDI